MLEPVQQRELFAAIVETAVLLRSPAADGEGLSIPEALTVVLEATLDEMVRLGQDEAMEDTLSSVLPRGRAEAVVDAAYRRYQRSRP
ncbi:MAG: hypothetical protein F4X36_09850 [Gammaproteobacteria bacterium]|nr:hypothetical protein [Gammaproteobacteria bacterium]